MMGCGLKSFRVMWFSMARGRGMVSASETRLGLGGGASMGRVESGVGSWGAGGGEGCWLEVISSF